MDDVHEAGSKTSNELERRLAALEATHKAPRQRRKIWLVVGGILVLLLVGLAAGGITLWRAHQAAHRVYFSASQLQSVNFPIYTPTQLPSGYHLQQGSTAKDQKGVLILTATDKAHHTIYISQQARISTFNYGGFFSDMTDGKTESTPLGELAYGYTDANHQVAIASLVTQKSWLIVNSHNASPIDLKEILRHLKPAILP